MSTFGLIGYPLKQSFSQKYFTNKFLDLGIDSQYLNFSIPSIDELPQIITNTPNLKGFNVTIPYKKSVLKFLDDIDDTAQSVGAVNVVKVIKKEKSTILKGYNSDIIGFKNSLEKYLLPHHKHALILGTGGASLAVEYSLKQLGIDFKYVSRQSTNPKILTYDQIDRTIIEANTLIINTTPLGMYPDIDTAPEIPYHFLTNNHLLFDLVYNPLITKFMELGQKQGALTVNGLEMLYGQAEEAWRIWNLKE